MERKSLEYMENENQMLREQLRFYQEYDSLTGLYNKKTFYLKAEECLHSKMEESFDIVCVDVERFKLLNDLNGPEAGDAFLRYLAESLEQAFAPKGAILARLANDVFAMCLPRNERKELEATVLQIFQKNPLEIMLLPAIGICPVDEPFRTVNVMCDWAILALESVKGNGLKHLAVYDSSLRSRLVEEHELFSSVKSALENHEFEVYMQPKCNMHSGKIVGAEALVRWKHRQRGMLAPNAFIPLFERNGFIKQLDAYVWEETAAWLRRWIDEGHVPIPVSVNISRIDIFDMDVCSVLQQILEKYQLEAWLLELEITESAYVDQPEKIFDTMERLMGSGFTVLMDDFGSGYSSLNMLNDINVNVLKIDMRFLERSDQRSKDILESVVRMAKWLNLLVIAEGVENQTQVDFLLEVGCVYAQGFFYHRPMPLKAFEAILRDGSAVDFTDRGKNHIDEDAVLDFHELFHRDVMSDRLMGNILGAIALYHFDGQQLSLLRGTEAYYQLVGRRGRWKSKDARAILTTIYPEDRALLIEALQKAKASVYEEGSEICVRQAQVNGCKWLQIRFFHLAEKSHGDIYYGSLLDMTEHMEAVEKLRISEEQFWLAMEATNIVLFELDVKTHEARYSEYAQQAFNLSAVVANAPEGFIEQGAVCERSQTDFRGVYEAIYRGEERASCLIQARMGDGTMPWNRITLIAVKDQSGETVKAVGMVETISYDTEPALETLLEMKQQNVN